jgi:adenylylsulfate kinase
METRCRSLLKALTYRIGGLAVTSGVAYVVTGKLALAAWIGILDTVLKVGTYYFHERAWLKIRFGCARPPEYDI